MNRFRVVLYSLTGLPVVGEFEDGADAAAFKMLNSSAWRSEIGRMPGPAMTPDEHADGRILSVVCGRWVVL
jgi:hypothetical protein